MANRPEVEFDYEAVLNACAAGRHEALEHLYRHESPRLLGVARRIVGDAALAEDIVHDAFVSIWKEAARFDPVRGSGRGWIYSITRHLALNFVRNHARTATLDEAESARLDSDAALASWRDARAAPDWSDYATRMQPCLDTLPPERRRCIMHAYLDGLTHAEIAVRLSTPLGTVKAWISRSLKALKECLS
ncbi:sigma-70 family RNA polymerase sigma factor [Bordetella petrii]|uniref:sigma-70 family RNA polymerase sigma factor n=1 Tax=Bordetella petrii TaxID=94624 RepID=UPI001E33B5C5|nr:sigma-70 family RNA polymerase sigma factor [Bordetella petrii]MCD0503349.1 sigma-70 family RNA polymerase sigma factor [Bordetella petrii]